MPRILIALAFVAVVSAETKPAEKKKTEVPDGRPVRTFNGAHRLKTSPICSPISSPALSARNVCA
jgi:hypothetical protein